MIASPEPTTRELRDGWLKLPSFCGCTIEIDEDGNAAHHEDCRLYRLITDLDRAEARAGCRYELDGMPCYLEPHHIGSHCQAPAEVLDALHKRVKVLKEALDGIAKHGHQQYSEAAEGADYATGVADGHRCAANDARAALKGAKP